MVWKSKNGIRLKSRNGFGALKNLEEEEEEEGGGDD